MRLIVQLNYSTIVRLINACFYAGLFLNVLSFYSQCYGQFKATLRAFIISLTNKQKPDTGDHRCTSLCFVPQFYSRKTKTIIRQQTLSKLHSIFMSFLRSIYIQFDSKFTSNWKADCTFIFDANIRAEFVRFRVQIRPLCGQIWYRVSHLPGPKLVKISPFLARPCQICPFLGAKSCQQSSYIEVMSFYYQFNCMFLSVNV